MLSDPLSSFSTLCFVKIPASVVPIVSIRQNYIRNASLTCVQETVKCQTFQNPSLLVDRLPLVSKQRLTQPSFAKGRIHRVMLNARGGRTVHLLHYSFCAFGIFLFSNPVIFNICQLGAHSYIVLVMHESFSRDDSISEPVCRCNVRIKQMFQLKWSCCLQQACLEKVKCWRKYLVSHRRTSKSWDLRSHSLKDT